MQPETFNPTITYLPNQRAVAKLPSAFPELTPEQRGQDWGKEMFLGLHFAKEFDLYRAITCYKRSLFLAPKPFIHTLEYHIIEAYYLGRKYADVIEFYEDSTLGAVPLEFAPLNELLLMLYDCYVHTDQCEKAEKIKRLMTKQAPLISENVSSYTALKEANFCALEALAPQDASLDEFLTGYRLQTLSSKKARVYNALLPGWGYYYVGQTRTAITAFTLNVLFTYAAVQFFQRGYLAAGIITSSIEAGWYLGGINGAGLAAKTFNERLYEAHARDYLMRQQRFPLLMFEYAF
jgi:hypothetical protein